MTHHEGAILVEVVERAGVEVVAAPAAGGAGLLEGAPAPRTHRRGRDSARGWLLPN